jgi:hypothetical protein
VELIESRVAQNPSVQINETFVSNITGKIQQEVVGNEIRFSVDHASISHDARIQWKWHYNSHAVHCNETPAGDLICKEVNPHIASEVWAEFFIPQAYDLTEGSNKINVTPVMETIPAQTIPAAVYPSEAATPEYEEVSENVNLNVDQIHVEAYYIELGEEDACMYEHCGGYYQ